MYICSVNNDNAMRLESKIRFTEYISILRANLLRKIDIVDCDVKYSQNPFEIEYLKNYKKFLQEQEQNLSDKLKDFYAL